MDDSSLDGLNPGLRRWQAVQRAAREERERNVAASARMYAEWLDANKDRLAQEKADKAAALVRHHVARRRVTKLQRTPPWADQRAIRAVYEEAQRVTRETGTPHHVDHVIPLQGRLVSGLHVHTNLQILTGSENSRKRNKYEVEA